MADATGNSAYEHLSFRAVLAMPGGRFRIRYLSNWQRGIRPPAALRHAADQPQAIAAMNGAGIREYNRAVELVALPDPAITEPEQLLIEVHAVATSAQWPVTCAGQISVHARFKATRPRSGLPRASTPRASPIHQRAFGCPLSHDLLRNVAGSLAAAPARRRARRGRAVPA